MINIRTDFVLQKKIIDSFPEPQNDYDRADYNYLCNQKAGNGGNTLKLILYNIISFFAIPVMLIIYMFNYIRFKKSRERTKGIIIIHAGNRIGKKYNFKGIEPNFENKKEKIKYYETDVFPRFTDGIISVAALKIFLRFSFRHPFKCFYNFRCLVNIMGYNKLLYLYSPEAIVNSRIEINPISSLVTLLCETMNCEFICYMHGDICNNIHTAFVRYSKFYIWDEHYKNVLGWSRCYENQYAVYKPGIYEYKNEEIKDEPSFFLTYYLSGIEEPKRENNAREIGNLLQEIAATGKKCKIRPHPRWSDLSQLHDIFDKTDIIIEDCSAVSVIDSIKNSEVVIGAYSTVLAQAYYMGKEVYVDNISDANLFKWLRDSNFFLLSKGVKYASEILDR